MWGQIAGSVLGSLAGKAFGDSGPGLTETLNINFKNWKKQIAHELPGRVNAAKKAGIHPLYALGMNSTASQPQMVGGDSNPMDYSSMGQDIGRAVEAYASGSQRTAKRLEALSLDRAELENQLLRSQIARNIQQGTPSLADSADDVRYPAQAKMPMGYGDTAPLLRLGRDQKGNPVRVYNDDLGDNELLQAVTALGYSIPDWIHGNVTRPASSKLRNFFKAARSLGRQYNTYQK